MKGALFITANRHQVEKAALFSKNIKSDSEIWFVTSGKVIPDKLEAEVKFIENLHVDSELLNNFDRAFFFAIHPNKKNFVFLNLLRELGIKVIAIQESHQLSLQNMHIFNIIFTPDLLIAASDFERDLIVKNNLFYSDGIFSGGWPFKSISNHISGSSKSGVIIFLGASSFVTPTSSESMIFWKELIQFISKKHPNERICLKPHPQEIHYLKRELSLANIQEIVIDVDNLNPLQASEDYKYIYTTDKSQVFLDLYFANINFTVFSIGKENVLFSSLQGKCLRINDSIKIKQFIQKHSEFDRESVLVNPKIENYFKELENSVNAIQTRDSASKERQVWDNIFRNKFNQFNEFNLSGTKRDVENFVNSISSLKNASMKAAYFLYFINLSIQRRDIERVYHKIFLNNLFQPIFVNNFPYQALNYYLHIISCYKGLAPEGSLIKALHEIAHSILKKIRLDIIRLQIVKKENFLENILINYLLRIFLKIAFRIRF